MSLLIYKTELHQETPSSSRNAHFIKMATSSKKNNFSWSYPFLMNSVLLIQNLIKCPVFDKLGTLSNTATSSRNAHSIKQCPLHQILDDLRKSKKLWHTYITLLWFCQSSFFVRHLWTAATKYSMYCIIQYSVSSPAPSIVYSIIWGTLYSLHIFLVLRVTQKWCWCSPSNHRPY